MEIRAKNMTLFLKGLLWSSLIIIATLAIFRTLFVVLNVPLDALTSQPADLFKALYNALRFDLQVVAYCALLPTVVMLIQPFIGSTCWRKGFKSFCSWYYMVVVILLSALSSIDLGYFANFNSHISITFFDFFDEEPLSLIQTIWDDYPVIWIFIGLCVLGFLAKKLAQKAYSQETQFHNIKKLSIGLVAYVAILVLCLRGSVGAYPLQVEDLIVSTDEHINDLIPNAPYMLKKAFKEKSMAFDTKTPEELLHEYSFRDLQEALDTFTDSQVKLSADTLGTLRQALFAHANTPAHPQPNVLILCCESWSNYLMHLGPIMQCGMQKHMADDIVFDNYQSVRNGTIATIENITVSTPYQRVFRSGYRQHCLPSSIALPFVNSGYSCEFLSGMDLGWENCGQALANQKFTKLTGKYELLKENPKAEYNGIGAYDEYMLHAILQRLNRKAKCPQMIMGMTTTNHPPLEIPSHAKLPELPNGFCSKPCFNKVGEDVVAKYLRAYQYFNSCLAQFLDEFKKTEAAKNTILVITGDHNVRAILNYDIIGKRWQNSVPLYIYLPPYLRGKDYPLHSPKWGCHYDLVATMAPFAFKNTDYMKLGNNLLDSAQPVSLSYSYNEDQVRAQAAYLPKAKRKSAAREMLLRLYFQKIFNHIDKHKIRKQS